MLTIDGLCFVLIEFHKVGDAGFFGRPGFAVGAHDLFVEDVVGFAEVGGHKGDRICQ